MGRRGATITPVDPTLAPLDRLISEIDREQLPGLLAALSARVAAVAARMAERTNGPTSGSDGPDRNLTVAEAAKRLGVSTDYLYRHSSRFPFAVRIGRRLLFSAQGLERWNQRRQGRD